DSMPAEPHSLDDLRRDIDEIDVALHDLLMRRTEIGRRIGAVKGENGPYFRPGREAQILRRLVSRHHGPLPAAVVVQIWREIIGALTALQGPFTIAACSADGPELHRLARNHYGLQAPIMAQATVLGVLRAVTEGLATIGVLPLPDSDDPEPWWRYLARDGAPRIVARLPFAASEGRETEALAISFAEPEESGRDRSFLILETMQELSRGTLRDVLTRTGLQVVDVQTWSSERNRRLHLLEIEGFLPAGDERFARLVQKSDAEGDTTGLGNVWHIGGYAVPLSVGELTEAGGRGGRP
ncbi:MAG: chorismate mutase, partial [Kiloniellales bacterium]